MRFEIRADFSGGTVAAETVTDENKTHDITDSNYIDSELNERFVGKFEDAHLPEVPEQDEDSEEYIPHID